MNNIKGLEEILDKVNSLSYSDKKDNIEYIISKLCGDSLISHKVISGINENVTSVISKNTDRVFAFCEWLKENGYTKEKQNRFEYGHGDRYVSYLGNYNGSNSHSFGKTKGNDVLYIETQNINLVVLLIDKSYNKELHVRKVYPEIEDRFDYGWYALEDNFASDLDEFKETLKGEDGLKFAITNLTSPYIDNQYADSYSDSKYPSRISLQSMIDNNFGKETPAFRYLDDRDENYIFSNSNMFKDKSFTYNLIEKKHALEELIESTKSCALPTNWFEKYNRHDKIGKILNK